VRGNNLGIYSIFVARQRVDSVHNWSMEGEFTMSRQSWGYALSGEARLELLIMNLDDFTFHFLVDLVVDETS